MRMSHRTDVRATELQRLTSVISLAYKFGTYLRYSAVVLTSIQYVFRTLHQTEAIRKSTSSGTTESSSFEKLRFKNRSMGEARYTH